jgi:hypothetical protein
MFWQKQESGGFTVSLAIRSMALPTRFEQPNNSIGFICGMKKQRLLPQARMPISPAGWRFAPGVAVPEICT